MFDRAVLQHVAEGPDAVDILPGGDGGGQGVGHAGQALVVVVGHHVLQPEEMVWLDAAAYLYGLVDVAHNVDVLAHTFPHHPHPLHLPCHGGLGPHLSLHLLEPHRDQARPRVCQVLHIVRPSQGAADVGWGPVPIASQQRAN